MLQWRLAAFERWLAMAPPDWAQLRMEPVDFQALSLLLGAEVAENAPKSLDEVDPQLLETYESSACPCTSARAWPGGGGCGVRFGLGGHHLP